MADHGLRCKQSQTNASQPSPPQERLASVPCTAGFLITSSGV